MSEKRTSELDKYLPPKSKSQLRRLKVQMQTEWPQAPERLRPLLDWFTETTSILPRTTADKKYQVKAASGFYEEFGSDIKLADKAYRVLRKSRYIVSSLDSLRKTARGLNIREVDYDSEEHRRKYLEGWTFDE